MNTRMLQMFQSDVLVREAVEIDDLAPGELHRLAVRLVHDGSGRATFLPVIVARGADEGPVFGITAAIHGNEINGIRVIQKLFADLDPSRLRGTVVGCPVLNLPAFLRHQRNLPEGQDLNRVMPGRATGNTAEVYAHRLMDRIIRRFDYLIDLHTASVGRENSLYVRADLKHEVTARMARLASPEIIVHNEAADGTLRGAAMEVGIPSITVEVGNPQRFQRRLIRDSLAGLKHILSDFDLLPGDADLAEQTQRLLGTVTPREEQVLRTRSGVDDESSDLDDEETVVCRRSAWVYSQHGGLLEVHPQPTDFVKRDEPIATVRNLFGDIVAKYRAPEDGVVVGRSTDPVCATGARILHLGIVGEP